MRLAYRGKERALHLPWPNTGAYYAARDIYPPGFLKELRGTLNLLWPVEDISTAKRVSHIEDKEGVDIEANLGHDEKYNLKTYPVFGERLAKIQERLETVQSRRGVTLGFKIALWGIVLTASFGLISAITGIMQVWASLQAFKSPAP